MELEFNAKKVTVQAGDRTTVAGGHRNVYIIINGSLVLLVGAALLWGVWPFLKQQLPGMVLAESLREFVVPEKSSQIQPETALEVVEATGQGQDEENAFLNAKSHALRQALENGIGKLLQPGLALPIFHQSFSEIQQQILREPLKFLTKPAIIDRKKMEGKWQVKVSCRVNFGEILNRVSANQKIREFLSQRVVVMVPNSGQQSEMLVATRHLAEKIEQYLVDKGMRVFVEGMAQASFREVADEFQSLLSPQVYDKIKDLPTDFLVCPTMEKRTFPGSAMEVLKIKIVARNRLGLQFAIVIEEYPTSRPLGLGDLQNVLSSRSEKINSLLYQAFCRYLSNTGAGQEYYLFFRNYYPAQFDKIEEAMHKTSGLVRTKVDRGEKVMHVDMAATENPKLGLQREMKRMGVGGVWYALGNWFVIVKPDYTRLYVSMGLAFLLLCVVVRIWRKRISKPS